ncbi:MAG: DNA-processing protein DprA, partial [Bdellovibrio sp.]
MTDLYSLSQILKVHPLYTLQRDAIHLIYRQLAARGELSSSSLLHRLSESFPEIFVAVQRNQTLLAQHC